MIMNILKFNICCCYCNKKDVIDPSLIKNSESTTNPLNLLLEKPEILNYDLENKISLWQQAISEYEKFEEEFLDKNGRESAFTLADAIKVEPKRYLKDELIPGASKLATKWLEILELQNALPFAHKQKPISNENHNKMEEEHSKDHHKSNNSTASKLSSIWSRRLNHINPTQGSLQLIRPDDIEHEEYKLRPKWPDFLTDVTFDVIKVNKYGQHLRRLLKFTQYHIISIKNGNQLTKFYSYNDVRRVWLENGTTIKVQQRNNKKNVYLSPIAPHILQQITTRVQVRKNLDKMNTNKDEINTSVYSTDVTSQMIKAISEENTSATEEVFLNFANDLKSRVRTASEIEGSILNQSKLKIQEDTMNIDDNTSERQQIQKIMYDIINKIEEIEYASSSSINSDRASKSIVSSISRSNNSKPKYLTFQEGTPEYQVQDTIRKIVFDSTTSEGNTRKIFIEGFLKSVESGESNDELLLKIRHFIDGMHEYILTERGFSFAMIYERERQQYMIKNDNNSPQIRSNTKKSFVRRASLKFLKENNMGLMEIDEKILTFISFIIFIVVEESVFLSIKDKIINIIRSVKVIDDELLYLQKVPIFKSRNQEDWGIPHDLVSPLNWRNALFELSNLENNLTPSHQLQVLTRTVKAIYSEFKLAIYPGLVAQGKPESCIAADDLVPIFIYVLSRTDLRHPIQNRDLMWGLCHPDQLHGESGYFLTVYESAIEYILQEPVNTRIQSMSIEPSPDRSFFSRSTSQSGRIFNISDVLKLNNEEISMRESFV